MTRPYRVVGLMSGTSADGIDIALIETDGARALGFGPTASAPYRVGLSAEILACAAAEAAGDHNLDRRTRLSRLIAEDHAAALGPFLAALETPPDLIGFHGQTVLHRPKDGITVQLGDASWLAQAVGLPVVADFRLADVAAGGEGAPFAPAWHGALAADWPRPCAFLNIGGVANMTVVGADGALFACDVGPGNALLDDWIRRHGGDYDQDGAMSRTGRVHEDRIAAALAQPWFAQPGPKSLDRNAFSLDIVDGLSLADGAATLAAFTAAAAAVAVAAAPSRQTQQTPQTWFVCGGGRHNPTIMAALAARLPGDVAPVEARGLNGDALEAQAMAFLAVRSRLGAPLSWPQTTGVPQPTTGGVLYPASACSETT